MKKDLTKKTFKSALFGVVSLVIIGIVLLYFSTGNFFRILKGHTAFEELLPGEISNQIVDASIKDNFGAFMEEYSKNTKTHVETSKAFYYVIWTGDDNTEDWRYMAIKVPASDEAAMEATAEATYNYEYSEPIEYSGAINKMTDEEYEYFVDYFYESGWTDADIEAGTLPYYIDAGALVGGSAVFVFILMGVGAALILIAIIRLVIAISGKGLNTIKKEIADAGLSEADAEYDYENAKTFGKKSDICIGRKLTVFMLGSKPHAVANNKVVWAYHRTTTHRTNGIKTGTTYQVVLNTYDRQTFNIDVNKESMGQEVLEYINNTMPWVVVGYNDDLNRMYCSDYQNFLQLRYNNTENENIYQE